MKRTHHKYGVLTLLVLALLLGLLLGAGPAGAIIGGAPDTDSRYSNVGMNVEADWMVPGCYAIAATCTLVRNEPRNVIVLLAAHQLAWVDPVAFEAHPNLVTFKAQPEEIAPDGTLPYETMDDPDYYTVTKYVIHPDFDLTPFKAVEHTERDCIGPGREDVALMWLDRRVKDPVTGKLMKPAPIIGLHGLEALDLTHEPFTAVGYGFTAWLQGSDVSFFLGGGAIAWSGRNYRQVSVVTDGGAFADRYLHLSQGQADFDSGSPLLHDDTITAVCSFGSPRQSSGCYDYRLDTYSAQDFLSGYDLVPDPDTE